MPSSINVRRTFIREECDALSSGDKSCLMEIPGRDDSFFLLDKIRVTSLTLVILTKRGRCLSFLYRPSLKESLIDNSVILESTNDSISAADIRSICVFIQHEKLFNTLNVITKKYWNKNEKHF